MRTLNSTTGGHKARGEAEKHWLAPVLRVCPAVFISPNLRHSRMVIQHGIRARIRGTRRRLLSRLTVAVLVEQEVLKPARRGFGKAREIALW